MPSTSLTLSSSPGDPPQHGHANQQPKKQVAFASGTQFESPIATARKTSKRDPSRSRRHLVYAIKLTEEGFRAWSAAHLSPPPADLEGEALEEQWKASKGVMSCLIPWDCSDDFDLPVVNESYVTLVRDGDERVPVVPLADNRARARHHRRPPADEVIAQVAEAIFQPGAVPGWHQVAP